MPTRPRLTTLLLLVILAVPSLGAAQQRPLDHTRRMAEAEMKAARRAPALKAPTQTANQLDYDVTYYGLDLTINPATNTVGGTVQADVKVVAGSIATVELDLVGNMTVSAARSGGVAAAFSHVGDILTVTLDRAYTNGEIATVEVDYSGTPSAAYGAFGFNSYNGADMIWSLSEPFGARSWWPCKDVPSDKADSVDVMLAVPNTLTAVSNGTLVSVTDAGGGYDRYHWHEGYPITTYLVSVAIHPYYFYNNWYVYSPTDSMEVQFYVFPDHVGAVGPTYALTVPMLHTYSSIFGEYPFINEKYGHAEFLWGGGMEHQTVTSLGGWGEYLIAHELAHQWYGDAVTCDDFHHIWLNEGFATYAEALWSEDQYGVPQYHADMAAAKYLGPGTIYVPDTNDWNRIFDSGLSYNKASWVLHMLRHVVGDAAFFDCLRSYYQGVHQYGTATTEEFRDVCEAVSGMDLDWFFQEWIYEEFYPAYSYGWNAYQAGGDWKVSLDIDQLQANYTFKMPIDVFVEAAGWDTTIVVWDSLSTQSFELTVPNEPVAVSLDPDEWILRTVEQQLSYPLFGRGVLVVNGVDFDVYGSEIYTAYQDSAFSGSYPISFWDVFTPASAYPPNLPGPLGHGTIPADTLKQFSTVIWVGNNYNGDLPYWYDAPINSYLEAGGNVLLLSRYGQSFVTEPMRDYLGITWAENTTNTLGNCVASHAGLTDMSFLSGQTLCAVFENTFTQPESELLFEDTAGFAVNRGLGVWRRPPGGGTHRTNGGNFAFISGRPYRYNHAQLAANVQYILLELFEQPLVPVSVPGEPSRARFALEQNYPNPFNPHTTIRFTTPWRGDATLRIYDTAGRLVREITKSGLAPGPHAIEWNGRNNAGVGVASGVYFYQLHSGASVATRKMVLIR